MLIYCGFYRLALDGDFAVVADVNITFFFRLAPPLALMKGQLYIADFHVSRGVLSPINRDKRGITVLDFRYNGQNYNLENKRKRSNTFYHKKGINISAYFMVT